MEFRGGGTPSRLDNCTGYSKAYVAEPTARWAFTLAEVLITLGIIGVVAVMTMPSLIAKHKEKELAVGIRKLYADVNNALRLSQVEFDGDIDYSTVFTPGNTNYESALAFAKYFNGAKVCQNRSDKGCAPLYHTLKYSRRYEAGTGKAVDSNLNYPAIILNNGGMLYIYQSQNANCHSDVPNANKYDSNGNKLLDENGNPITYHYTDNVCALIYFDINGPKAPNRYGQDASRILIEKTRVVPSAQPYEGAETLKNVLSGIDKFVYDKYTVGE